MKGQLSNWSVVASGVLKGLILGPPVFNNFISDLGIRTRCIPIKFETDTKLQGIVNSGEDWIIIWKI